MIRKSTNVLVAELLRPRIWTRFQVAGTSCALCGFNRDDRAGVVQLSGKVGLALIARASSTFDSREHLFRGFVLAR